MGSHGSTRMVDAPADPGRRAVLTGTISVIAVAGLGQPRVMGAAPAAVRSSPGATLPLPGAFVALRADNTAIIYCNKPEMGQGTLTSLARILADELDLSWSQVNVALAPATEPFTSIGDYEADGSSSVRDEFLFLRRLGAGLRALFLEAAAMRWSVPPDACATRAATVVHETSGRSLRYCDLAADLVGRELPKDPPLKPTNRFQLIGQPAPNRLIESMTDGSLRYGIDFAMPRAASALLIRPPATGAALLSFDADAARCVPGVLLVEAIPEGVAIVAERQSAAWRARELVTAHWDTSATAHWSATSIREALEAAISGEPTFVPIEDAPAMALLRTSSPILTATYSVPYQAHAAIEPACCIAAVADGVCDLWLGTQGVVWTVQQVSAALGLPPPQIRVHPQLMGGSFGRKGEADVAIEATRLSQRLGRPVKVMWLREDEMARGPHRPCQIGRMTAHLGANGLPAIWEARLAGPSYALRTVSDVSRRKSGATVFFDGTTIEGLVPLCYPVPRQQVSQHWVDFGVSVGAWRSTSHSFTAFFRESFIDEIARMIGADPFDYRLRWLQSTDFLPTERLPKRLFNPPFSSARMNAVLAVLRTASGWDTPTATGTGRGLAIQFAYEGYAALVAEVAVTEAGIGVRHLWLAADLGQLVNPNAVDQQLRGGLIFGLSAALHTGLTITDGTVVENNFDGFPIPRIDEAPNIHVNLIASDQSPAGVGEMAVPLVAPAVANAVFAATGQRLRDLPLRSTTRPT
jgi:isoquinoline 1-oxidoreductase subunit beta